MKDLECRYAVTTIVFSPTNPNMLITGHLYGELRVWNIADSTHVKLDGHYNFTNGQIQSLCVSADGRLLCSTTSYGDVVCCHDLLHGNTLLWLKVRDLHAFHPNIAYHEGCFMIPNLSGIIILNAVTGDHEKISSGCAESIAVLHLRKIGLLHLTFRCDVNLHSEHCMAGSLTKPALRTPQHQSDDTQHGDGLITVGRCVKAS